MGLEYKGQLSLGECMPLALQASAQLSTAIGVALPDVQARVDGLLALSIAPPPSLADLLAALEALLGAIQTLIAVPLPDVTATVAALAELQATLGSLGASLGFQLNLASLLATPGIFFYLFAGRADEVGPALSDRLTSGLPGGAPGESVAGAILLAKDAGAIAALRLVLG